MAGANRLRAGIGERGEGLDMTLAADAERNRLALIAQLYDEWHGFYILQRLEVSVYVDVRPLTREEAVECRLAHGQALSVRWPQPARATLENRRRA